MNRCLYNNKFEKFLNTEDDFVFGQLCDNYHGEALTTTREAWKAEIAIMKEVLSGLSDKNGDIIFEYDIPRLGKRIDVVLLYRGIIFCLEFKVNQSNILEADIDQVLDYALDLKNFHFYSQDRVIVPILIATNYKNCSTNIQMSVYDDRVVNPLVSGAFGVGTLMQKVLNKFPSETPVNPNWIISPYAPTPTIIEAAKSLYENHSVESITRHEADKVSTDKTISYILQVIKNSKLNGRKSICFVTGVPGAGKTLVGLDVAIKQTYQGSDIPVEDEGAVYLSGNGPLVAVLNEALAQDNYKKCNIRGEKKKLTDSRREVSKSIQMIHRYRDNMLAKIKNPVEDGILEIDPDKAVKLKESGFGEVEHVAIFDEAQRAWTHKRLAEYLKRGGTYGNKLKVPNFPMSEAAFLIWSLDQREDWATIVCLVGGGQEINTGEAGITEWIKALNEKFTNWDVYISPKLTEAEYAEGKVNELLTKDGRLCSKQLFDKPQLQKLQTDFYEEVGKKYGLQRGKEGNQRKHLSTAEFKAKKIIEQAEAIRQENQIYADALKEAKSGEYSRNKIKLKQQAIAAVAENADLKKRLNKSMCETLEYAKKAETLERQKDTDSHYAHVGKTLAKNNPKEYERIIYGKPKTIGNFFDSVLSLFTPEITRQVPRLQQIEAELEEERKKQEKQSKNNNYKN